MNTFGHLFRLTTFGESHGPAMGAVIDGCPAGVELREAFIQQALDRRRPGQSPLTSARAEEDRVEILSGVYQDKTLGTPIGAIVRNRDARPQDYAVLATIDRPGHADAVWRERFGHRDPRGGGRSSGRETVSRVLGGAIADAMLARDLPSVSIVGWVSRVADLTAAPMQSLPTRSQVDQHPTRCPDLAVAEQMSARILKARDEGDSLGGAIDLVIAGLPIGLGEPVFAKLKSVLAGAFAGVGAVTGVLWGADDVLGSLEKSGREFHSEFAVYGGIQGGMSNGLPVTVRVFFKPPATLAEHATSGRHDPCILPRAVPVLEAMASLSVADLFLQYQAREHGR